ncbi:M protein trans-acting positive regulator [Enterococcus hirae]|nr:M protein trans-acting positive regulator [Enterococcus hirae]
MRELQLSFISNKPTIRLFNTLNYIERNRSFTIGELAEQNDASYRTTANDIKYLKEYFKDSALFTSTSNGYIFQEIERSLYKERKKQLLENELLFKLVEDIFYGRLERIDELAYQYNYSESAFRRLLMKCNPILKSYGLKWVSNPLTISGSEASLRKFFKDFFYEGVETPYSVLVDQRLPDLILNKVADKLSIDTYEVATGTTPTSFYYNFFITLIRVGQGCGVTIPKKILERVYEEKDFLLISSVSKEIEMVFGIHLSKEEFAWVYLVTMCDRTFNYEKFEKNFFEQFNLWPEITKMTEIFLNERKIPVNKHAQLAIFLKSFLLSIKIKDTIDPVLNKVMFDILDEIVSDNTEDYERNYRFLQGHKKTFAISETYMRDICISLTLYSDMLLDYYESSKKVYFLLEGNHLAYQSIRIKALKLFGNKHELTFVPIQSLTRDKLNAENIDLIVTNYSRYIADFINDIDYILVKDVPDEQDWSNISNQLRDWK